MQIGSVVHDSMEACLFFTIQSRKCSGTWSPEWEKNLVESASKIVVIPGGFVVTCTDCGTPQTFERASAALSKVLDQRTDCRVCSARRIVEMAALEGERTRAIIDAVDTAGQNAALREWYEEFSYVPHPMRHSDVATLTHRKREKMLARWSKAVKERDGYVCTSCGSPLGLSAHHVVGVDVEPERALSLSNGVTLCAACHAKQHVPD